MAVSFLYCRLCLGGYMGIKIMSTKIYNGYKINKELSAHELMKFAQGKIKPALIDALKKQFLEWYPTPKDFAAAKVWSRACDIARTKMRDPMADFEIEITFFPVKLNGKEIYLAMLFCEHRSVHKAFENLAGVSEFMYWNNTDPPDDISEKEFDKRGRVWDRVLKSSIPNQDGFSICMHSQMPLGIEVLYNAEQIEKFRAEQESE